MDPLAWQVEFLDSEVSACQSMSVEFLHEPGETSPSVSYYASLWGTNGDRSQGGRPILCP
jgi:hypothetical protein